MMISQIKIDYSDIGYLDRIKKLPIIDFVVWLQTVDTGDVARLLPVLEDARGSINDQLDRSQDAKSMDRNWYWGARRARGSFIAKILAVQAELGDRKRIERESFERGFINAARVILDKDTYVKLSDVATRGLEGEGVGHG